MWVMLPHWILELYIPSIRTQSKEMKSWQNIKAVSPVSSEKTIGLHIENSIRKF
jgi:hypothetical protein